MQMWDHQATPTPKPWSPSDLPKEKYDQYKLAFDDILKSNPDYDPSINYITLAEFVQFITQNPDLTEEEREKYKKQVNADGDDKISFEEFAYWMEFSN